MLNFVILIFLSLLCLPGFTQEDKALEPISAGGGRIIIRGALEQDSGALGAQQKNIKLVETVSDPIANPLKNPLEEIRQLGFEQITAASLMDEKVLAILQRILKEHPFSSLSPDEVKALILERSKGSVVADVLKRFPKLLDLAVDLIRDEKAIPGLLGIFSRKNDLKSYGYIWLVIFIFGLFIKSRVIKPKWAFKKRFLYGLAFSLLLSSFSLYIFYSLFSEELSPTLSLVAKNIL